jgi:hypothetical protein
LDTAYHSFVGEVAALNTTTIRRLTPFRRHQLQAIALSAHDLELATIPRVGRKSLAILYGLMGRAMPGAPKSQMNVTNSTGYQGRLQGLKRMGVSQTPRS